MTPPPVNQKTAADLLQEAFRFVVETQAENISAGAALVVDSLTSDGVVQVFGTGHSRSFAMEIAGRAGGLVPANKISLTDLVFLGDTPPAAMLDSTLERDEGIAARLLALHDIRLPDVFVVCSNSGGNGSTVELARLVTERGHRLIAVTSMAHTTRISSRHSSGRLLYQLADVVIDNGGAFGDASLELPPTDDGRPRGSIVATSSLTGTLIAQLLVTEVCGRLLAAGREVPVLISANIPGGDEHNQRLRAAYAGRVRSEIP